MFIDIKFCKFMPGFLVSNKSGEKERERKLVCRYSVNEQHGGKKENQMQIPF